MKRYNAIAKFGAELTKWLKFNYSLRYVRQDLGRPTNFGGGLYERIGRRLGLIFRFMMKTAIILMVMPIRPAMSLALGGERDVQTDKVYHQASLVFEPVKNWITNVEFNYSTNSIDTRETGLPYYNHDVSGNIVDTQGTSSLYQDYKKESYMNWNIYSTYSLAINDDHNFKVMGGFQSEEMRRSFLVPKDMVCR